MAAASMDTGGLCEAQPAQLTRPPLIRNAQDDSRRLAACQYIDLELSPKLWVCNAAEYRGPPTLIRWRLISERGLPALGAHWPICTSRLPHAMPSSC